MFKREITGFIANETNRSDMTVFISLGFVAICICSVQLEKPKLGDMPQGSVD